MKNNNLDRRNKLLALLLGLIALLSVTGAVIWFMIYAPIILQ